MKEKIKKLYRMIIKVAIPLCGIAASICMFVADCSQSPCLFLWGYEIEYPTKK